MCFICSSSQHSDFINSLDSHQNPVSASLVNEIGDAAAGVVTTAFMSVGDTFSGALLTTTDEDWIEINLVEGASYNIDLDSLEVNDSYIEVRDSSGNLVAGLDDGINDFSAGGVYTASSTGTFYIAVSDFFNVNNGAYEFTIEEIIAAPPSFDAGVQEMADYLTTGYWDAVGFSDQQWDTSQSNVVTVNISGLTNATKQLAIWAMESWEMVIDVDFQIVTSGEDITIDDEVAFSAYAYQPNSTDSPFVVDGVELNVGKSWGSDAIIESYWFQTYIHEFGHALGLGHQGDYEGSGSFATDAEFANDSWQYSVMSYFSQFSNPNSTQTFGYVITPMMVDIIAAQDLYGKPDDETSATAGDTIYGDNSTLDNYLDTMFGWLADGTDSAQFNMGQIVYTLYDVSGDDDLLDFGFSTTDSILSLVSETFSSFGNLVDVLAIATDTIIENVILGSGDDTITLNEAANSIVAGSGNDTIVGVGGNDEIDGGVGSDIAVLDIAESDIIGGSFVSGVITVQTASLTMAFQNVESFALSDVTLTSVELIELLDEQVTIFGTNGEDADIDGNDLGNFIYGYGGADVFDGQEGNDRLYGGEGADDLSGGDAHDFLFGGDGADSLFGDDGNDRLYGHNGDDIGYGGAGNDTLVGHDGNDTYYGGEGDDTLLTGQNDDLVYGGFGNDSIAGANGSDLLYGDEGSDDIDGGSFGDTIYGGGGSDTLDGGAGVDTVYGQEGDDIIYGGSGRDSLYGGIGADEIYGGNVADLIFAGDGNDLVYGGTENDSILGGEGSDTLYGDGANDRMDGGAGRDFIYGGIGNDYLLGDIGDDNLFGGDQNDRLEGGTGEDELRGGSGGDTIFGGEDNDSLYGEAGIDLLYGGDGDDLIEGGNFGDTLIGGDGEDIIYGGVGTDRLQGGNDADILFGGDATDQLFGGGGDDILYGGANNDVLAGNGGSDTFVFAAGEGTNTIIDFSANADTLVLNEALLSTSVADFDISGYVHNGVSGLTLNFEDGTKIIFTKDITEAQIESAVEFFI